ncbi:MAG: polysaccharide export protein [Sphingomonadales bacterium]|nr:polysaccharide export protein [Sphingomonadales bacterium]
MRFASIAATIAMITLSGCASSGSRLDSGVAATNVGPAPTYNYALAGGDKLRVIVFGEPTLGGDFVVGGSGYIGLPLIGEVQASGLTSTDLQARIASKLTEGDYIKEPRVVVEVLSARPYYILGEVNKPGEYPYSNGMTVESAVAQAGGYTYRATTKAVLIKHAGESVPREYSLSSATAVAPGDIIRVRERWF